MPLELHLLTKATIEKIKKYERKSDIHEMYAAQLLDPPAEYTSIPKCKRDSCAQLVSALLKRQGTVAADPAQPQKSSGVCNRISAETFSNVPGEE